MKRKTIMLEMSSVKPYRLVLFMIAAIAMSGCQMFGAAESRVQSNDTVDYSLIADNMVNAVSQYPKLNPLLATVQMNEPENAFAERVYEQMATLGYKLETAETPSADNQVIAQILALDTQAPEDTQLYKLSVGKVTAEREYGLVDGLTVPLSPMTIDGGEKRTVTLNDTDVFGFDDEALTQVSFASNTFKSVDAVLKPELAGAQPKPPTVVRNNIYDTMQSNYTSIFEDYENVEQIVLVFPNDSLRLGDTNKQIIQRYVEKMDTETDVLSVIGCSHGNTEISNGNSLLALGRANRVKEAFMFSGVEHEHVLDEGCWAPETFSDVMPNRGVVLTLKRRIDS